jgi:hypothetical protein
MAGLTVLAGILERDGNMLLTVLKQLLQIPSSISHIVTGDKLVALRIHDAKREARREHVSTMRAVQKAVAEFMKHDIFSMLRRVFVPRSLINGNAFAVCAESVISSCVHLAEDYVLALQGHRVKVLASYSDEPIDIRLKLGVHSSGTSAEHKHRKNYDSCFHSSSLLQRGRRV